MALRNEMILLLDTTYKIITDSFGITEHDEWVDFTAGSHLIGLCYNKGWGTFL